MYYVNWWVSGKVSALHSVVAGSISSREYHGNTLLMRPNKLSSVSVCHEQVFAGFSGQDNSIHNIIPPLKENVHINRLVQELNSGRCVRFLTATYLPSANPSKLDEQDMQIPAGEARSNSLVTFSYGLLYMAVPVLADRQELTYNSSVRTQDIVRMTCR